MLSYRDFEYKAVIFVFTSDDHIRFANENFVVEDKNTGKIKNQMPCVKIFCVFVIGAMTITNHLLEKASRYGFGLVLMKFNFKPYAFLGSKTEGNTLLREKQYLLKESHVLATYIVKNKISNQLENLNFLRDKTNIAKEAIKKLTILLYEVENEKGTENTTLLGREGNASKIYFKAFFEDCNWKGRKPRAKFDPMNTLMDIGYTFLFNFIEAHLNLYGFDLYVGFYHRLFYQRKSLVCDLVEPFRAIIDRCIRKRFNLKQFKDEDFIKSKNKYFLRRNKSKEYTKVLFQDLLLYKEDIYFFIRDYYRSFVREKDISDYPHFIITSKSKKDAKDANS